MTFSIIGYDPDTGEIGVAVHSKAFAVGNIVPFAKAGIGAVATQSLVNVKLGPLGLELMEEGRSPSQSLDHMREIDNGIEYRQLGFYSIEDGSFAFTGDECIEWGGHQTGEYFSCQGNILQGPQVIDAMVDTFENSTGSLAERLVEALQAGEAKGGDKRGSQSASLIIEQIGKGRAGYGTRKLDLRVDDHETPIDELSRLVAISDLSAKVQQAMVTATEDKERAIAQLNDAITARDTEMPRYIDEALMSLATLYYKNEQLDMAKTTIKKVLSINPGAIAILREYPRLGLGFSKGFIEQFE